MRRSPQSAPPAPVAVLVSWMSPPPQAVRPRHMSGPTTAAKVNRWVRRGRRAMAFVFLPHLPRPPRRNLWGAAAAAVPRRRVAGDPVEHDAERRDGDAGGQALA